MVGLIILLLLMLVSSEADWISETLLVEAAQEL
jgi:hypothetical protein